jgi:type IV pilus assembly protein PilM
VINSYVSAIHSARLTPVIIDVDYFALENMFELNYAPEPEEVVALINVGARYPLSTS